MQVTPLTTPILISTITCLSRVSMSILRYFQKKKPEDSGEFLVPISRENTSSTLTEATIEKANEEVRLVQAPKRRKTECVFAYSEEVRAAIGNLPASTGQQLQVESSPRDLTIVYPCIQ